MGKHVSMDWDKSSEGQRQGGVRTSAMAMLSSSLWETLCVSMWETSWGQGDWGAFIATESGSTRPEGGQRRGHQHMPVLI